MDLHQNSSPHKEELDKGALSQGCFLFLLVLANQIRINEWIKGLKIGNKVTKLSLYANDTTVFI